MTSSLRLDDVIAIRYCPRISERYDCVDSASRVKCTTNTTSLGLTGMVLDPNSTTECRHPRNATLPLTEIKDCTYYPTAYASRYWLPGVACTHDEMFPK